jgi:hypothetical protein
MYKLTVVHMNDGDDTSAETRALREEHAAGLLESRRVENSFATYEAAALATYAVGHPGGDYAWKVVEA